MEKYYESKKFYNAFDPNSHLVMAEHHQSNKFYAAFDAFDSNAHLAIVMAKTTNGTNSMMLLILLMLLMLLIEKIL